MDRKYVFRTKLYNFSEEQPFKSLPKPERTLLAELSNDWGWNEICIVDWFKLRFSVQDLNTQNCQRICDAKLVILHRVCCPHAVGKKIFAKEIAYYWQHNRVYLHTAWKERRVVCLRRTNVYPEKRLEQIGNSHEEQKKVLLRTL